jgi:hypothetical protein
MSERRRIRRLFDHRTRQTGINLKFVARTELVFTTMRGQPQSWRNALRAVHHAGDDAKLNGDGRERVGLHDLWHSFVALDSGATLADGSARPPRECEGDRPDLRGRLREGQGADRHEADGCGRCVSRA